MTLDRMDEDVVEDVFLQEGLCPTIAEHAAQCNSLFRKYMVLPHIVPDPTIMDDQLARFTLWASNMDVFGPLNVSLDYRLRFSPTVVDIIHQLLDVICDTLASLKPINEPPQTPSRKRQRISVYSESKLTRKDDDDASDSDSDVDEAEENISKITDTIGGTVSRLFRLSNAVRKSAKANRARKLEKYRDDEEANKAVAEMCLYTDCYIRFRFPMAPDSLRSALVEANALRLRRLYYQRSHRRRIDMSVQSPQISPPVIQMPQIKEGAAAVRFAPSVVPKSAIINKTPGQAGPPPVPVTNATTARQTAVGAFYAKSTTEVPRAKSVLVNNKLSFPPIPPTQECPYCGVIIEFKNTSAKSILWNNHVIGDLEPFICTFPHCLEAGLHGTCPLTFESSKAWISHMQNAHGHAWECRAPSHDPITFDQEIQYQKHSIEEHDVPEAHAGTLSNAARRPVHEKVLECPFGDDFHSPESNESSASSAVFSSEGLQLHVAAHMKEIALLTLQKLPNDGDEDAENVDSDQPLNDDGPGLANLRGSMYSILDDGDLDFQDDEEEPADSTWEQREEDISASVTNLNLEDKDDSGMTKLHRAVQAGDQRLVEVLISEGVNLTSRDNGGRTVLHYAAMDQSHGPDIMALILGAGGTAIINLGDDNGQTALHYAAERSLDCVRILSDYDADIHAPDGYGFSPFLWAVIARNTPAVHYMLKTMGADSNSTSADGTSALAWASCQGNDMVSNLLMDYGASTQTLSLTKAAAAGDIAMVELLLNNGRDPNYRDRDGWTAIHWAAEEGHANVVAWLLDYGADVNAASSYGTSPLHCAANGGSIRIMRLLLERGADPLKSTCHGWTALHHAAFVGYSRVVQMLLEDDGVRSNASQQDNHGWSVLHLAVHSRDLATIDALIGVIPEPRALVDESGLTAEEWLDLGPTSYSYKATSNLAFGKSRCCRAVTGLRQAVVTSNVPMAEMFIRKGYGVNGINSGRRTALYYAAKQRMLPMMDLLLENGADPNILPTGRKSWEEFVSDNEVLLRLSQAGYRRQDTDPEVERQIRLALRGRGQSSVPARSVSFAPNEPITPISFRPPPLVPDQSASLTDTHEPNKRQ
ncbi:hypothetical protein A9Z42_0016570 [Trichoderma parareesei]|uniref:Uncharacterized protein n=1 Tax=Trichoderma parareesei TaxID=858221 RepID=A0A2H2ZPR7_TRIPA|nr:hypothetical protein A9Z42_0016570 [Trichoderma parareesei]